MCDSTTTHAIPFPAESAVLCLAALSSASVLALLALDCISWVRTSSLRRGVRRPSAVADPDGHRVHRTSRLTMLPAVAGATLGSAAAIYLACSPRVGCSPLAYACVVVGLFVAAEGIRKRVTSIEVGPDGLVIGYARSPPNRIPWSALRILRPPRWPVGGWRLVSNGIGPMLMPTDLWGCERLLERMVLMSELRFDGRAWVEPEPTRLRRS